MSDPHNNPPVMAKSPAPKTWDFMETLFVAMIAYAVFSVTGWLAYAVLVAMQDGGSLSPATLQRLNNAASTLACGPTIAVLWIAV